MRRTSLIRPAPSESPRMGISGSLVRIRQEAQKGIFFQKVPFLFFIPLHPRHSKALNLPARSRISPQDIINKNISVIQGVLSLIIYKYSPPLHLI